MTTSATTSASGSLIQFSGLASGLDTSSIISSLMSVEAIPQQQLQARMTAEQAQISALQGINTTIAGLGTTAQSFVSGSTWTQLTSTSSNTAFTVTSASTSTPASVSVSVTQSAAPASASLTSTAATSAFQAGSTYTIAGSDGTSTTFTVGGTGSITDIAAAINATTKTSKLSAVVIDPTGSSPTLQLVSTATGTTSDFSVSGSGGSILDTSPTGTSPAAGITTTAGLDAQLSVNNVAMTSSSNSVTIMPGVQVTIPAGIVPTGTGTSAPATTTVSVTDDGSSRANAMKMFVQQINSLLTTISSTTAYGTITPGQAATGGGALPGNSDLRDVATQLVSTIFAPGDSVSLANMGLSVDEYGQLTFDSNAFKTAYQADPQGVQNAFIGPGGFVDRVNTVAYEASAPDNSTPDDVTGKPAVDASGKLKVLTGSITSAIDALNKDVKSYSDQIAEWTDRLQAKQASLEAQYTNLETTLSKLQSQQSWLSSQLDSLNSSSSSSQ